MIKQGNSDTYPEMIVVSNGFFQCRYNILPSVKKDIEGNKISSYNYNYIEVKELSEALILEALAENECKKTPESVVKSILAYKEENGILGNINEESNRATHETGVTNANQHRQIR